ncbi:hypothetical protein H2248_008725 [Termitomyces sp. 'cryptogamus']|nr:hypothetical protein H2248_008725 [Termitomyces sp. 'cryptogamus']
MLCFGFSKTFLGLVMSRALYSTWNANVGVIKGTIAELSDGTNLAQMVAFVPVTWATGGTIGPLTGGFLSHPAEHFPEIFGNDFWRKYPYLLPCIVPAVVSTLCWIIVYLTLRETVRTPKSLRSLCARSASSSTDLVMAGESQESTQLLIPSCQLRVTSPSRHRLAYTPTCYFLDAHCARRPWSSSIVDRQSLVHHRVPQRFYPTVTFCKDPYLFRTKKNIHNRAFDDRSRDCCLSANELRGENAGDWTVALAHPFPTSPLYPRDLIFIWYDTDDSRCVPKTSCKYNDKD